MYMFTYMHIYVYVIYVYVFIHCTYLYFDTVFKLVLIGRQNHIPLPESDLQIFTPHSGDTSSIFAERSKE